jgi:hypothetical protein
VTCWNTGFRDLQKSTNIFCGEKKKIDKGEKAPASASIDACGPLLTLFKNFVERNRSQVLVNTPNIIQEVKKVTLKQEMEESGESTKNMRRDPRLVLYLLSSI